MASRQSNFLLDGRVVSVTEVSITALEEFDVLVTADDNYLSHASGVSSALWEAAGPELTRAVADASPVLRLGDVYQSSPGALRACSLLHAITVDLDASRFLRSGEFQQVVARVLDQASDLGTSVALGFLGGVTGGLSDQVVCTVVAAAVHEHLLARTQLDRITIVARDRSFEQSVAALAPRFDVSLDLETLFAALDGRPEVVALRRAWLEVQGAAEPADYGLRAGQLLAQTLEALIARPGPDGAPNDAEGAQQRRVPVNELAVEAERLLHAAGRHPGSEFSARCAEAVAARNRIAHGPGVSRDDVRTVLRACREVIALLAGPHAKHSALRQPARAVMPPVGPERAAPFLSRRPSNVAEFRGGTAISEPSGADAADRARHTAPVRALHSFLMTNLPPASLDALEAELRADGYQGSRELALLEYCVRVEDPALLLTEQFNRFQLRPHAERVTGEAMVGREHRALAIGLLDHFGFARQGRRSGLAAALATLRTKQSGVALADESALKALVIEAGTALERVVVVLLRFLCEVAFRRPADLFFRDCSRLSPTQRLDSASLGTLLELLEYVANTLERGEGPLLEDYERDFRTRRLAPAGATDIAGLRNRFAHLKQEDEGVPLGKQRERAADFFERAIALLEYLGEPGQRIFPIVLHIERVVVDRWGRLRVEASTDEGMAEQIFTDRSVAPGEVYYMHPLSNPLRVDPILVQAGELELRQ